MAIKKQEDSPNNLHGGVGLVDRAILKQCLLLLRDVTLTTEGIHIFICWEENTFSQAENK